MTENQLRVIVGALGWVAAHNPNIVWDGCAGSVLDPFDDYLDHCDPKKMVEMIDDQSFVQKSLQINLMPER